MYNYLSTPIGSAGRSPGVSPRSPVTDQPSYYIPVNLLFVYGSSQLSLLSKRITLAAVLFAIAGDIELNPGPAKQSKQRKLHPTLSVGSLNCRSAAKKSAVIHELIHDTQLDVLFLSETWFTSDTPKSIMLDVAPDGFSSLHVVRQLGDGTPSRGGGLAAVFRDHINLRVHPLAEKFRPSTFELQLLRLSTPGTSLAVMNVYRPQWMSSVSGFVDELADIVASLSSDCSDDVLLCGDVNCPGLDHSSVDVELADCFQSLTQLVGEPTRCVPAGSTAHLLDVLATSRPAIVNDVKVSDADFLSDHRLVSATVATRVVKPVVTRASRNIRSIDTAKFDSALRQSELFSRPATTVDSFVEQLDAVLTRLLDDMAPVRLRRRRDPKPTSKWLSDDAIASKRRRRRLERRWRKSGAEADRQIYRRACREANQLINQSRSDYYRQRIESVGADCRKRWKVVRELLHHNDRGATRQDDENRNLCHTFSNYFVDKICRLQSTVRNKLHMLNIVSAAGSSDLPYSGPGFSAISPVTAAEVLKLLHSAPPKSSRMDTVPTSLLLAVSETFSEIIAYLANLSFSEGRFPTKFKSASVTPLLKSDHLDKTAPASYRPISNLNFISKILERLFLQCFQPHILASPNFNKHQSAYRPGHSTETALLLLLDNIFHAADSGKSTLLVSLDLSAAFDTIEHSTLLQRLIYSFGVTGTALSWIKCYLTDRNQSVCIGQYSSPVVPCSVGVPHS